tara:strand:- start:6782 stop:7477 length:696 start_codon:yes stop_codon:yes gene_type:complete
MLQSIDKKYRLFFYLILFVFLSTQITKNKEFNKNYNTNVINIEVSGLSNDNNIKIIENLSHLLKENIFFIKKEDFKNILEKNNLIDSFYIKKVYPNLVRIKIKQTDFLAVIIKENKKFYIGSNGRLIPTSHNKELIKKLPFVYSKSNYTEFINLKKIIDDSIFRFEEIESFYYFPSNRWDLKTKDGILIKLPEKNIREAIKIAELIKFKEEFKNKKIIDLRIQNNIILSDE